MNALLQCIARSPLFINHLQFRYDNIHQGELRRVIDEGLISSVNLQLSLCECRITEHLIEVCKNLRTIDQGAVNPQYFFNSFVSKKPRFKGCSQQDCFEAYLNVLDCLKGEEKVRWCAAFLDAKQLRGKEIPEELKAQMPLWGQCMLKNTITDEFFGGTLLALMECTKCLHVKYTFEPFVHISLAITSKKDATVSPLIVDATGTKKSSQPIKLSKKQQKRQHKQAKKATKAKRKAEQNALVHTDSESLDKDTDHLQSLDPTSSNTEEPMCNGQIVEQDLPKTNVNHQLRETENRDALFNESDDSNVIADVEDNSDSIAVGDEDKTSQTAPQPTSDPTEELTQQLKCMQLMEMMNSSASAVRLPETGDVDSTEEKKITTLTAGFTLSDRTAMSDAGLTDLERSLLSFTDLEVLAGDNKAFCTSCVTEGYLDDEERKQDRDYVLRDMVRRDLVLTPPVVLTLQIKRFALNAKSFRKSQDTVSFPVLLNLSSFCSHLASQKNSPIIYHLFGVVEHKGHLNCGHYVSYVRIPSKSEDFTTRSNLVKHFLQQGRTPWPLTKDYLAQMVKRKGVPHQLPFSDSKKDASILDQLYESSWFLFDDSKVKKVDEKIVMKSQAYMLFYERIQ